MSRTQTNTPNQRTEIIEQVAELSSLLGMIPSDHTIEFHSPVGEERMVFSDWLSAARGSFLELSLLISKELDIQLQ